MGRPTDTSSGSKRKAPYEGKDGVKKSRNDYQKSTFTKHRSSDNNTDGGAKLNVNGYQGEKDNKHAKGVGKPSETGQTSRESHIKQKQLAQERKAAKPLADEVHRTKKIWERLRLKSHVPKEERKTLLDELYTIITGRIKDLVTKHDAVRAVQTAIKYSTVEQRRMIAKELQGAYAQLAESKYAKFLIGKLLVQNDAEIRDMIIPEFYGRVRKMINHPEASWILDDIYRTVATKQQRAQLLREWYGAEYQLFKSDGSVELTSDLSKILETDPSKRGPIMKHLFEMINQLIQKKLTGFTMLHDAMLQYFLNTKPDTEEFKEFVEIIKEDENGDLLKNMAFTQSGARLVCLLLAYGTAKERKQMLKTYKDTFQLMSGDKWGHVIILTAYDVIDDTVLTGKSIFPEILGRNEEKEVENVIFLANDLNARTTILYLFEGMNRALFPPSHAVDLEILKEVHEIRTKTSKKEADTRRKELINALSPYLLTAISTSPRELISTSFGCHFIQEVMLSAVGDKEKALEAIAATAEGDPEEVFPEDTFPPPPLHVANDPHAGRMLKTLVAGGRYDKETKTIKPVDPPLNFANILYPHIKEHVVAWATGASSFVILGLLESEDFSSKDKLKKTLTKNKAALEKAATEETAQQKAKREEFAAKAAAAAAGEEEETKDKKKQKKSKKAKTAEEKERPVGNMGSQLILEKLNA
jgi:pumilio family protein 6